MKDHQQAQLRIIARRAFLGDEEEKRLTENHGEQRAKVIAKLAARRLGVCDCTRSDGIICGTKLWSESARKVGRCYRCWSSERDDRACDHDMGRK